MKNLKPLNLGLLQAVAVLVYCLLVGLLFMSLDSLFGTAEAPILGITFMLILCVFSVAIMGLVVFGYPLYFAIHQEVTRALKTVAYTVLFSFVWFVILGLIILAVY